MNYQYPISVIEILNNLEKRITDLEEQVEKLLVEKGTSK